MNLSEYQTLAARTIPNDNTYEMRMHSLLGMASETGELVDAYFIEDYTGIDHITRELGDLMWMIAEFCTSQGWHLGEIVTDPHPTSYELRACVYVCKAVGELTGIYQKVFQGHQVDKAKVKALIPEIYHGIYSVAVGIGVSMETVMDTNIQKLRARYPDGFDADRSLHRADGDV